MAIFKRKSDLIHSVAELKNVDYSANQDIKDIYNRLVKGREQFEVAMSKAIEAVMQISSLDLVLTQDTDKLTEVAGDVDHATSMIYNAAEDSSAVAGQVNMQHEDLTRTIVEAAEDTSEVHKKIESSQEELTNIYNLSMKSIERCIQAAE